MFAFLRRKEEHPHWRELGGLVTCIVAWRRAGLEHQLHSGGEDSARLEERRTALAWYAHGSGCADPFTDNVVRVPVGQLDEGLEVGALYRIETAGGIAWALGILPALPGPHVRADARGLARAHGGGASPTRRGPWRRHGHPVFPGLRACPRRRLGLQPRTVDRRRRPRRLTAPGRWVPGRGVVREGPSPGPVARGGGRRWRCG